MSDTIIPDELREAPAGDAAASEEFDRLPPSHKREYNDWITKGLKPILANAAAPKHW